MAGNPLKEGDAPQKEATSPVQAVGIADGCTGIHVQYRYSILQLTATADTVQQFSPSYLGTRLPRTTPYVGGERRTGDADCGETSPGRHDRPERLPFCRSGISVFLSALELYSHFR